MSQSVPRDVIAELAPGGVLRAGINLGNFLLVSGKSPAGEPEGVAPDMAREIARRLGVPVVYVPFARPGELADAAGRGVWDIGLIAAEPARAEMIAFSYLANQPLSKMGQSLGPGRAPDRAPPHPEPLGRASGLSRTAPQIPKAEGLPGFWVRLVVAAPGATTRGKRRAAGRAARALGTNGPQSSGGGIPRRAAAEAQVATSAAYTKL